MNVKRLKNIVIGCVFRCFEKIAKKVLQYLEDSKIVVHLQSLNKRQMVRSSNG